MNQGQHTVGHDIAANMKGPYKRYDGMDISLLLAAFIGHPSQLKTFGFVFDKQIKANQAF